MTKYFSIQINNLAVHFLNVKLLVCDMKMQKKKSMKQANPAHLLF